MIAHRLGADLPDGDSELLVGEGLKVHSDGKLILDIERISLLEGEILAVLGPNGSGKSTLLRVLALLQRPTAGRVRFRGATRAGGTTTDMRRATASVFQRPHLWRGSVRANVELGLRLARVPARETRRRAEAVAAQLGLTDLLHTDATRISTGEAQRVAIARALVLEPEILILDEPTANLDADVRASLREDLERVARARARATLLATHDRSEAFYLADRVAVLRAGRVVQVGAPSELYENPSDPFIARVTGAELSFSGRVTGTENGLLTVAVGETTVIAVGSAGPGAEVKIAYRPEDLFLARGETPGGSARNRFRARITETRAVGSLLRIRLAGPTDLVAIVTRAAAEELDLRPGVEVTVQVKATALHAFPR